MFQLVTRWDLFPNFHSLGNKGRRSLRYFFSCIGHLTYRVNYLGSIIGSIRFPFIVCLSSACGVYVVLVSLKGSKKCTLRAPHWLHQPSTAVFKYHPNMANSCELLIAITIATLLLNSYPQTAKCSTILPKISSTIRHPSVILVSRSYHFTMEHGWSNVAVCFQYFYSHLFRWTMAPSQRSSLWHWQCSGLRHR